MSFKKVSPCGWYGTIATFLSTLQPSFVADLCAHHLSCMNIPTSELQRRAWNSCFVILQQQLALLLNPYPEASEWTIIFEYELPRERGRRPDVVILANDTILVLEFKDASEVQQAYIDQVAAYAQDLQYYHAGSHHHIIFPIVVLTRFSQEMAQRDEVWIVSPTSLPSVLSRLVQDTRENLLEAEQWLTSDYAALPSLVSAARTIFRHEPLPHIRRAYSAGIPETIAALVTIGKQARAHSERHLALVTGVPGAGKTLVGLQFVYENHFEDLEGGRTTIFLSGNGPLVKVLQHALGKGSSAFVQDVHGFLKQYGGNKQQLPEEHIWVYDEAQRAWDAARVQEKRGHGASEPEDFLRLGERMEYWALMVGLIGEGQEIHLGEEAGLEQWNTALQAMSGMWTLHCPSKIKSLFPAAARVESNDALDLTMSLRSHLAEDVQRWVSQVLDGQITEAANTAQQVIAQGFALYITQNLEVAKRYVCTRYQHQEEKRYGLLASSKARNLSRYGIQNEFNMTKNLREGPWYNDSPESSQSCCQLREVATEFACQGLELDLPIVGWGNDLFWHSGRWQSPPQPRSSAHNPHRLRLNSYRVLLSRGRDGLIIFVPKESATETTYMALMTSGLRELS